MHLDKDGKDLATHEIRKNSAALSLVNEEPNGKKSRCVCWNFSQRNNSIRFLIYFSQFDYYSLFQILEILNIYLY